MERQKRDYCFLTVLLENGTFNGSSEAEKKTQSYYLSCLNTQKIEELGAQPLIDLIIKVTHIHCRHDKERKGK